MNLLTDVKVENLIAAATANLILGEKEIVKAEAEDLKGYLTINADLSKRFLQKEVVDAPILEVAQTENLPAILRFKDTQKLTKDLLALKALPGEIRDLIKDGQMMLMPSSFIEVMRGAKRQVNLKQEALDELARQIEPLLTIADPIIVAKQDFSKYMELGVIRWDLVMDDFAPLIEKLMEMKNNLSFAYVKEKLSFLTKENPAENAEEAKVKTLEEVAAEKALAKIESIEKAKAMMSEYQLPEAVQSLILNYMTTDFEKEFKNFNVEVIYKICELHTPQLYQKIQDTKNKITE